MGIYDTVMVPCPQCGRTTDAQSKSGPCELNTYAMHNAPDVVLENVNRHAPFWCKKCEMYFKVHLHIIATSVKAQ